MSYAGELRDELARTGIRGAHAERIVAEFEDHLACDPEAQLGAPREVAERFASELRVVRTRRATVGAFLALALCGVVFLVVVATHGRAGGSPWSALAAIACAQIALVAGLLALMRGLRARSAGDLRVAQRRAIVALLAGAGVALGLAGVGAYAGLVALPGLVLAARVLRRAAAITPDGEARGLEADLPFPRVTLTLLGASVTGVVLLQGVLGEKSVQEGLIRAGVEGVGLTLGVLLLGRPLALRTSRAR
ncbi:MAG TPA: hypothetical protein VFW85_07800 [Gaiellaceae bacterium]|nr:hypothetical protein [Gaiellaceae bacterium]